MRSANIQRRDLSPTSGPTEIESLLHLAGIVAQEEKEGFTLATLRQDSLAAAISYIAHKDRGAPASVEMQTQQPPVTRRSGNQAKKLYVIDDVALKILKTNSLIFSNIIDCPDAVRLVFAHQTAHSLMIGVPPAATLPLALTNLIRKNPGIVVKGSHLTLGPHKNLPAPLLIPDAFSQNQSLLNALLNQATIVSEKTLKGSICAHLEAIFKRPDLNGKKLAFFVPTNRKSNGYITFLARNSGLIKIDQVYDDSTHIKDEDVVIILDDVACTGHQAISKYSSIRDHFEAKNKSVVFAPVYSTEYALDALRAAKFAVQAGFQIKQIDLNRLSRESNIPVAAFSRLSDHKTLLLFPHMCPDTNVPLFTACFAPQVCLTKAGAKLSMEA